MLSASANKLSRLKEQAEEYAALIMEELDPEGLGYIEVNYGFLLASHQAITIPLVSFLFFSCQDSNPTATEKHSSVYFSSRMNQSCE